MGRSFSPSSAGLLAGGDVDPVEEVGHGDPQHDRGLRGAHDVAQFYVGRAYGASPALIDGALGIRVAPAATPCW
ncbi:MAG: hypothetical protein SYR96_04050 [Actinomycetota bacterium]|nr:hypothetical protein [Actinomycetota bacterium]